MGLDYQAIGTRVRRLRKARGLTQQTLAELSDHRQCLYVQGGTVRESFRMGERKGKDLSR